MSAAVAGRLHGREVSGRALRIALGLATAAALVAVIVGSGIAVNWFWSGLILAAVVTCARFPGSAAPTAVCVFVVALFTVGGQQFTAGLVLAASLLHTVHVLAGLAEVIPARARIEAMALRQTTQRWARVQLTTVPILIVLAAIL